ncbi:Cupin superfamily protein [Actinokineospora alba]|uniref:Cupin superfamily protein n=1 Tax=Actinokineospora alba TaxID=504798 RepID=A0A1H0HGD6_9PSEU|nr:cupin-like domain-containing protein [Actinokineospora alba]TDP64906.1 hypothetical protein C8E96_0383 [Actinokineospora alba]SDH49016.1 Cupin superfamily protein [Actinokineospora alba]SDO17901.1 Cupin superfamily protein [Actinokineospora alba]
MLDFATLVAPHSPEDFLGEYWPTRPCLVDTNPDRATAFSAAVPELDSAERLLSTYPAKVGLMGRDGFYASVPNGPAALPFLRQGFTCYLRNLEDHLPALSDLLDTVARDLALPREHLICEVFCSRGESGVAMHSDYDLNFAMQLHGTKRWRLAPNDHAHNITTTVFGGGRPQRDPGQLRFVTSLPLPERMPDDAIEFTAERGGLVFLPRDWWHETHALGECLQLNVVVKGPMWLTVLTKGLSEALVTTDEWRDIAHGIAADGAGRARAVKAFATLLGGLRARLDSTGDEELAERLIAAAYGEHTA